MAAVGSSGNGRRDKGYTCEAAGVEAGHDKKAQGRGLRRRQGSGGKGGSGEGGEGIE